MAVVSSYTLSDDLIKLIKARHVTGVKGASRRREDIRKL